MLRIYLDNCCYNRPFDDLAQAKIKDEAEAKIFIQTLIKNKSLVLYSSFMLLYEINDNPFVNKKEHISKFVHEYSSVHVGEGRKEDIKPISEEILRTGVKEKDAIHLSCSIIAECDYFIPINAKVI